MSGSVAVIGGGQGGASVAQALRRRGFQGSIDLLCAESVLPYERPPLSKEMLCTGAAPTWVLPSEFYADERVGVHLDEQVTGVARQGDAFEISSDRGVLLNADTVVMATGSFPRSINVPGIDLANVHMLNTVSHVAEMRSQLTGRVRVVIAGGGFVGSEVAAGLRTAGCDVVVIDPVLSPLAGRTAPWVAERLRDRHVAAGVRFVQDTVASLQGDGRVREVRTSTGETFLCDLFLVAIGSQPATGLAEECGIACDNGVTCDERGRTSVPGVYAIGDVASWLHPALGRLRVEHYRTAIDHADVVAADIIGEQPPALRVPWFWTDQYEHRLEVAGIPSLGEDIVLRPGPGGDTQLSLHLRDRRVVGVVALDAPKAMRAATRLIESQEDVDRTAIADPAIDLRKVVHR